MEEQTIKFSILYYLWFSKSLFLCYLVSAIFMHAKFQKFFGILTLLLAPFISLFQFSYMYPCFLIGILLKKYAFFEIFYRNKFVSYCLLILSGIFLIIWNPQYLGMTSFPILFSNFDWIITIGWIYLIKCITGIVVSITIIIYVLKLVDSLSSTRFNGIIQSLSLYGKYTLQIYILQSILLEVIINSIWNVDSVDWFISHFILFPIISMLLVKVLTSVSLFMEKNPSMCVFLGSKCSRNNINEKQ